MSIIKLLCSVQDWGGGAEAGCASPGPEAEGRVSAQSLTSETAKPATPPGDEVWAQKCHELDFQVINISLLHFVVQLRTKCHM